MNDVIVLDGGPMDGKYMLTMGLPREYVAFESPARSASLLRGPSETAVYRLHLYRPRRGELGEIIRDGGGRVIFDYEGVG